MTRTRTNHVYPLFPDGGLEHVTSGQELWCWCNPKVQQLCNACNREGEGVCLVCEGSGWVPKFTDEDWPTVVTHNVEGMPDGFDPCDPDGYQ